LTTEIVDSFVGGLLMQKTKDVGVIVGRFQVHRLHEAHRKLLSHVYTTHAHMVVVLGLSAARVSTENPLDFEARKQMILAEFPKTTVFYIKDDRDDKAWSMRLDAMISDYVSPAQTVCLYGGRDSFIARYHGAYPTEVLEPDTYVSGTEMRKTISKSVKSSEDFRAGVIWATANGYPRPIPTVDIAVFRNIYGKNGDGDQARAVIERREWLLVRKPTEHSWRFPGGFVTDTDPSYQAAARRELGEETGVEIASLTYVWDGRIDDWRYRYEREQINTILFAGEYQFGPVKPADDVAHAQWWTSASLLGSSDLVVPEHAPLVAALKNGGWFK
jgi:bifunctional NMN adenylyltransferase/nudix hydrolase